MSSSKKSTRSSRAFAPKTADELTYEDLAFSKYEDLFENVDEGLIRKYIEDEAKAVAEQRENDVSLLNCSQHYLIDIYCRTNYLIVLY